MSGCCLCQWSGGELDCDIVVVGCGVAGLSAVLTALEAGVNQSIEFCSQFFTLFSDDIISMGSGPGNAFFWKKYLEVGDRVKATIDGQGVQAFSIAAEVNL